MNPLARLLAVACKPERLLVGLMSGTSMDGLDIALVRVNGTRSPFAVALDAFETVGYDAEMRARLRAALEAAPDEVAALDFDLGRLWAAEVCGFLERAGLEPADVDMIGSHGQTIFHRPGRGDRPAATLQVGQGDLLAEGTGIPTVSDFRPRDIAAGGEGAPLIPMADWLLYARPGHVEACQNLGGIANVTVLPERLEDVLAFDTGPANTLIDALAGQAGEDMDRDGLLSARGRVDADVLQTLLARRARWLAQSPPKSAGFGTFGPRLAGEIVATRPAVPPEDLVRTAVEFTARTLADAYENHVLPRFPDLRRVRFSGGGCRNPTLMTAIRAHLDARGLAVEVLPEPWVDAKEAVGFALLADLTVRGEAGNVPAATGASRAAVLGKISL